MSKNRRYIFKAGFFLFLFLQLLVVKAQQHPILKPEELKQDTGVHKKKPKYYRKEEIIFEAKRYRLYNNYMTFGPMIGTSTIREETQKGIGLDFNWHIRRQYFQTGVMMSGLDFGNNNNVGAHIGYGHRVETNYFNVAGFVGPSFNYGVEGNVSGFPEFYSTYGLYLSGQVVAKFMYDMGVGLEVYGDISYKQTIFGIKIIAFFSGAYKGPKKNINPNVRAENPKWEQY